MTTTIDNILKIIPGEIVSIEKIPHGLANEVYKVSTTNNNYILKVYNRLPNFNNSKILLDNCSNKNIYIPTIIKEEIIDGKTIHLYEFIEGEHKSLLNDFEIKKLVSIISNINVLSTNYDFENTIFNKLNKYVNYFNNNKANKVDQNIIDNLLNNVTTTSDYNDLVMVHGDISPTNIIINNELYVLDFDEAVIAPISYELVSSLIKFCYKEGNFNIEQAHKIIKEFCSLKHVDKNEFINAWYLYIVKVILEKLYLYEIDEIDLYDEVQIKDNWELWYKLYLDKKILDLI